MSCCVPDVGVRIADQGPLRRPLIDRYSTYLTLGMWLAGLGILNVVLRTVGETEVSFYPNYFDGATVTTIGRPSMAFACQHGHCNSDLGGQVRVDKADRAAR